MNHLKHRFVWASALTLAATVSFQVQTMSGTICIITRFEQDLSWNGEDGDQNDGFDYKGPGQCSPGDVAMAELLADYGYSPRVTISREVFANAVNPYTGMTADPEGYLHPIDMEFNVSLIIQSGSGSSSYAPPMLSYGIPIMSGEHVCLSNRGKPGDIYMYTNGGDSTDAYGPTASQYMKVLAPNHPIMKGIPLDEQGRVKLIRDAYPEENAHVPPSGNKNWGPYCYPVQKVANAAPGTTVLGVVDNMQEPVAWSCFAVVDVGGVLSNGEAAKARLVHYFVCEGGSNDSRRCFNALSDLGRVIFVRAAKWAMGETLEPYKSLGIKDVTVVGQSKIKVAWEGSADKNYKILGSANVADALHAPSWETIVQDIPGTSGTLSRTLDISAAPQVAFLRIQQVP